MKVLCATVVAKALRWLGAALLAGAENIEDWAGIADEYRAGGTD